MRAQRSAHWDNMKKLPGSLRRIGNNLILTSALFHSMNHLTNSNLVDKMPERIPNWLLFKDLNLGVSETISTPLNLKNKSLFQEAMAKFRYGRK
jgi:hypothetical protein